MHRGLARPAEQAGFAIKGVFGDFAGKPVSFDSPKIVVVAAKS